MTVFYNKELAASAQTITLTQWQRVFYKFRLLSPLFPKIGENDGIWYWISLGIVLVLSVWLYTLGLFFVFQALADKLNLGFYLAIALIWFVAGFILPSGIYRLIIFILKKQKIID